MVGGNLAALKVGGLAYTNIWGITRQTKTSKIAMVCTSYQSLYVGAVRPCAHYELANVVTC